MKTRYNQGWRIALRCLGHPWSWLAIGCLLVNDHILKRVAVSVLTGKLSDFAGLFFFPFLLAAISSFIFPRNKTSDSSRKIGRLIPFILTALWFTAIKTLPWANALMVALLSRFIGPVQIVRDPTDCIALLSLWPAWLLWRRLEQTPVPQRPSKRTLVALTVASLAVIATSPSPPIPRVTRLVVDNNTVYTPLHTPYNKQKLLVYSSTDGQQWGAVLTTTLSSNVFTQLQQPALLPVSVCDPHTPLQCYRVTGETNVQSSNDGGQSWKTAWRIPWGRQYYITRYHQDRIGGGKKTPDAGAYDIVSLQTAQGTRVIIARGNEGVLVRQPDGKWERYAVAFAEPTPFAGHTFIPWREALLGFATAVLMWIVTTGVAWRILLTNSPISRKSVWISIVFPVVMGILCAGIIWGLWQWRPLDMRGWPFLLIPACILLGVGWAWRRIRRVCPHKRAVTQAQIPCWLAPGSVALSAFPIILWMWGVVPFYSITLALSIGLALSGFVGGLCQLRRIKKTL